MNLRTLVGSVLAVGLTLGLAACAGGGDDSTGTSSRTTTPRGTFPQTVATKFGDIEV